MTPYLALVLAVFGLFAAVLAVYSTRDQLARAAEARAARKAPARQSAPGHQRATNRPTSPAA